MKSLKETLSTYFTGFRAAVTTTLSAPPARIAFIGFIWAYLLRLSGRVDRLVTRWQNGTLPRPRAPRPPRAPDPDRAPRPAPQFRLPRGRMWLIRQIQGTAFAGSQLRHLLATDERMQAFLEAAPQAGRMLAPLFRMLGVDPEKPYGVPLVKPPASPPPEPAPAPAPCAPPTCAPPTCAPPAPAASPLAPAAAPPADPPLVFSSP